MKLRFVVYKHKLVMKEKLVTRYFIILKDVDHDITLLWTNFHQYITGSRRKNVRSIHSNNRINFVYVVRLLNYVFWERYHISCLEDLTIDMVKNFMNDYAMKKLPDDNESTHRGEETVFKCQQALMNFVVSLIRSRDTKMKFTEKDLYTNEKRFNKKKRRMEEIKVPVFDVCFSDLSGKKIFRDIPEKAFKIIFDVIITQHKNLLMLVALSAFAGLRPSEACNVRREDSRLGPGIRFERRNEELMNVYIDLTDKLNLRTDLVDVGTIKKYREQKVYPKFLNAFASCYAVYMQFIKGKKYEAPFGALTNNRFGKAITYASYYREFQKVIAECIPIMLESEDPQVVNYGFLLQEHHISPHVFRHWFSVKLAIYGENHEGLMHWRGDKSPESAITYIQNKSDLTEQYSNAVNKIFDYERWAANKMYGGK